MDATNIKALAILGAGDMSKDEDREELSDRVGDANRQSSGGGSGK
ncbi:hypothetical protein [Streptomyces kronopolitis]